MLLTSMPPPSRLQVIFCGAARTQFTADLLRVDDRGVVNLTKAMQDEFVRREYRQRIKAAAQGRLKSHPGALRRLYSRKSKKEIADFSQVGGTA
jgi:hypothetical protein